MSALTDKAHNKTNRNTEVKNNEPEKDNNLDSRVRNARKTLDLHYN